MLAVRQPPACWTMYELTPRATRRDERIGVVVPAGRDGGTPGSWDWTGLAFAFFAARGLAIRSHAPSLAQSH
jgi:hypothetical protein